MSRPRASTSYALIAGSITFGVTGQALLKIGASAAHDPGLAATLVAAATSLPIIAGLGAYALSSVLWLIVLSRVNLSMAYPFGALAYVLVAAIAVVMGEHIPPVRWAGVILIVLGVLLVGAPQADAGRR